MSRDRSTEVDAAATTATTATGPAAGAAALRVAFADAVDHLERGIIDRDYFAANYWVGRARLHLPLVTAQLAQAGARDEQARLQALHARFDRAAAVAPAGGAPSMPAMGAWLAARGQAAPDRDGPATPGVRSPLRPENRDDGFGLGDAFDLALPMPSLLIEAERRNPDPLHREGAEMLHDLTHDAPYLLGFAKGSAIGSAKALRDFVRGVPQAGQLLVEVMGAIERGTFVPLAREAVDAITKLIAAAPDLAAWFAARWNAADSSARGEFRGEACSYGVTLIALAIVAAFAGPISELAGEFAIVIRAIEMVDLASDITTVLRPLGLLGKSARTAGTAVHAAGEVAHDATRAGQLTHHADAAVEAALDVGHTGERAVLETTGVGAHAADGFGDGAWATGAKSGDVPARDSIRYATVVMEAHPDYAVLIAEAEQKGFKIVYGPTPRVALLHVVDETGAVVEVRKQLYLVRGMRFLDLEHEMGHVRQLDRFGDNPPPTEKIVRTSDGIERAARGSENAGAFTSAQNAVIEYHNRLDEYVRIASRGAPPDVLADHAEGVQRWLRSAASAGLGQGGGRGRFHLWAKQIFPDLPALENEARSLGLELGRTANRW